MNALTEVRTDIANLLSEAGIRAVDFNETRIVPPLAVVIPSDEYITAKEGNVYGHYNISIQVLILGPKATEKVASTKMDELIITAIGALDDHVDIINVSAPGEARLNDTNYFGSIIDIEVQLKFGKDK